VAASDVTDESLPAQASAAPEASGAGATRSRRFGFAWVGLAPFFVYIFLFFLLPIGVLLFTSIRKTVRVRNPATQLFEPTTSYTAQNIKDSFKGIYRTSMVNSLELSAFTALLGAVIGILLAYAVVTSSSSILRQIVIAGAAVMANFGGVPLAFLFIATVGNAGVLTAALQDYLHLGLRDDLHFQLTSIPGISLVYLYFLIPLMVLVMTPALEGLKPQWAEAAENLGASRWHYWRHVAGPVLFPNFLGSVLLLFCSAFSAYATAFALVGSSFPLIPTQIKAVLGGNVLPGQDNLGAALALNMVVVVLPLTVVYQLLQRRTSKWLA
jgi:putative spermidine/putrescine transport system permease protein